MDEQAVRLFHEYDRARISRRQLLQALGIAGVAAPIAAAFGSSTAFAQGRCRDGFGTQGCPLDMETATKAITPVFDPTGWRTVSLDHIAFQVADHKSEAAFYVALMGWKLRSLDDNQAVMDLGDWGTVVFKKAAAAAAPPPAPAGGGGGGRGRGGASNATVQGFCWDIAPWNAKTVEAELTKRGLSPVADNDGKGFESFHVKDPDGFALQISNGGGHAKARKAASAPVAGAAPAPFDSPGWKTVWLDHLSFSATNYKESASFYMNLLGWKPTYDEGSQHELMIGEIGDVIIRGGNIFDPNFGRGGRGGRGGGGEPGSDAPAAPAAQAAPAARSARIDHISFGISPWDTDGVKAELEKRGLPATVDTSTKDDIHVAQFKSYHTRTPNGYNLQISYVTHDNRLALPNAVKPKAIGG